MRFYTWRNDESRVPDLHALSAARHSIVVENVGWGQVFINHFSKVIWLADALSGMDGDEIILCADNYDVLYVGGEAAILRAFLGFQSDIVFSAESLYSHQDASLRAAFESASTSSPYKFLNAGSVIGYAGAIRDMLSSIMCERSLWPNQVNDQWFFGRYCHFNGEIVKLDNDCKLFWCAAGEWDDLGTLAVVYGKRVLNARTNTYPCLVHLPWSGKYQHALDALARRLRIIG